MDDAPYTGDLDLDAVNTRDDLAALLRTVHVRADKPSLRILEARTRHTTSPLSKTAVAEMLRGARFPRKTVMVAFLRACGVKDDGIELWRRAWERVAAGEVGPAQSRAVQAALATGNTFLAEQHASRVADEAENEDGAERARGERMPGATSALADPAAIKKLQSQPSEPQSGVSAVSPAELKVFGAELTKTLRMRRKTIEQTAARLAIPPSEVARWAAGQELPSEPQARLLDEYLTARGAIQNLLIGLRFKADHSWTRLPAVASRPVGTDPAADVREYREGTAGLSRQRR